MTYLRKNNQDLLNRLQSKDVKTFLALSQQNNLEIPDVRSRSDLAEVQALGAQYGIGDSIYDIGTLEDDDDELREALFEIGWSSESE